MINFQLNCEIHNSYSLLSEKDPYSRRFYQLLTEIKSEVDGLKTEVRELKKENSTLESKLKEQKSKQGDVFSSLEETKRIAIKHQIKGLISKIDDHLEDHQ